MSLLDKLKSLVEQETKVEAPVAEPPAPQKTASETLVVQSNTPPRPTLVERLVSKEEVSDEEFNADLALRGKGEIFTAFRNADWSSFNG